MFDFFNVNITIPTKTPTPATINIAQFQKPIFGAILTSTLKVFSASNSGSGKIILTCEGIQTSADLTIS